MRQARDMNWILDPRRQNALQGCQELHSCNNGAMQEIWTL